MIILNQSFGNFLPEIFKTGITLFIFILVYTAIFFFIKRQDWSTSKKHKHAITTRNFFFFFFIITLLFIWSGEIKTFIFSAAAIVGALFIVFKELILALVGTILTNKTFYVGDHIEYDGIRGKIIDKNFFHTRVLISDPFQNKELVFPNMHYITNKIINMSKFGKFQSYSLVFGIDKIEEAHNASDKVLSIAKEVLSEHINSYVDYFKDKHKENIFFEIPNVEPQITHELSDIKKIYFTLHFISHPLDKYKIEKEIINKYLILKGQEFTKSEGKNGN